MLGVFNKVHALKNDLKKIATDPLAVAGRNSMVKIIEEEVFIQVKHPVNALSSHHNCLVIGLQDGTVVFNDPASKTYDVYSHASNVCALDFDGKSILSGSWDNTAILYRLEDENSKKIFKHPQCVWAVKITGPDEFITGCADGIIRIYKKNELSKEISWHSGPVRGFVLDDKNSNIIYSVDNNGNVLKLNMNGKLLNSRELGDLTFCICKHNDLVVVGGENGFLYVLNENLELLARRKMGCSTIWDVKSKDDAVYAAGSDGCLYILKEGDFEEFPIIEEEKTVEQPKEEAQVPQGPTQDGVFVSGGIKYKVEAGKIYMEHGNDWELIGDTVGKYDHSFPVTLGDKEYTLSFNDSEPVHDVTTRFLNQNKLGREFHHEIVEFITKNFKKATLFKRYDNIDITGIQKVLGNHEIIGILEKIKNGEKFSDCLNENQNIYQIENLLFKNKDIPRFVAFDICKFLISKNIRLDFSSFFNYNIETSKEAKAFSFMATNLVEDPPITVDFLDKKICSLRDQGLLTEKDCHYFFENLSVKKSK